MTDIRALVQKTLDDSLYVDGIFSYWQRKSESGSKNEDEYVVYTRSGDSSTLHADNEPLVKSAGVTLRYYYRKNKLETSAGRALVTARETTILTAMKVAGFFCQDGAFDAGDVDGIGFFVSVFEFNYDRVV